MPLPMVVVVQITLVQELVHYYLGLLKILSFLTLIYTYQNFDVNPACGFQRIASQNGCADGWSTDFVADSRIETDLFTCLRVSMSTSYTYQNFDVNPARLKISATCSMLRP